MIYSIGALKTAGIRRHPWERTALKSGGEFVRCEEKVKPCGTGEQQGPKQR